MVSCLNWLTTSIDIKKGQCSQHQVVKLVFFSLVELIIRYCTKCNKIKERFTDCTVHLHLSAIHQWLGNKHTASFHWRSKHTLSPISMNKNKTESWKDNNYTHKNSSGSRQSKHKMDLSFFITKHLRNRLVAQLYGLIFLIGLSTFGLSLSLTSPTFQIS